MGDWAGHERSPKWRDVGAAWEINFYEDILKRHPDYVDVLSLLGGLYTRNKMYAEGLKVDQRLATLKEDDPIVHYNLACSYSLLNEPNRAFEALDRAMAHGYRDADHMEKDRDLDNVRSDPRYAGATSRMRAAKH
ncbi:MAG: hypothetical protein ABIF82_11795 [Planctomycetota bacterium]